MKLALFDIDGTLIQGLHTEQRFARWLWAHQLIGARQAVAFAGFALRYLPRFGTQVLRKNKAYLAGFGLDRVEDWCARFAGTELDDALFEPACTRLLTHRRRGDIVWLLSGTLDPLAAALARRLGASGWTATPCPVRDERLVAEPPAVHPYGRVKLDLARDIAKKHGVAMDAVVAYGDSWADRFLLEAVGTAVAVMPDRRLARLADARGWEILGRPPDAGPFGRDSIRDG